MGIIDRRTDITLRMNGSFIGNQFGPVSGTFSAHVKEGMIVLTDEIRRETACSPWIKLIAEKARRLRSLTLLSETASIGRETRIKPFMGT